MSKLSLLIITIFMAFSLQARDIVLVADYWMPFSGDGETEIGYLVEIARIIFKNENILVTGKTVPWDKAVEKTRAGKYDGVLGAYKNDVPDFVFPKNEQYFGGNDFFVHTGSVWRYKDTASLINIKLGVIEGYTYSPCLDGYIASHKNDSTRIVMSSGAMAIKDNLLKLLYGKVDAIVDNSSVVSYTGKCMNISDNIVSAGNADKPQPIYIAFSPAIIDARQLAETLSKGMEKLRASGKLAKILKKYGLTDWK